MDAAKFINVCEPHVHHVILREQLWNCGAHAQFHDASVSATVKRERCGLGKEGTEWCQQEAPWAGAHMAHHP